MNLSHIQAALNVIWDQTADIATIPDNATADSDRETVVSSLRCSRVVELTAEDKQRAGMGSVMSLGQVSTEVPAVVFDENDRFICAGVDYRIRKIIKVPVVDPKAWFLYVEDES